MKNKKITLIITVVIIAIAILTMIIYFFSKNVNKNLKTGNNLSNKPGN